MNEPANKELIDHIASKLGQYEEPYMVGSWESFNKIRKKRGWFTFITDSYGMAASFSLTLFLLILPYGLKDEKKIAILKDTLHSEPRKPEVNSSVHIRQDYAPLVIQESSTTPHEMIQRTRIFKLVKEKDYTWIFKKRQFNKMEDILDSTVLVTKPSEQDNKRTFSKWNFAIGVSPAMGTASKMTVGGGLSIEYALTHTLSLRSGLSINNYLASTPVVDQPSSKRLTSIDASISTLDLPLELMVSINKRLYASTGISSVALLQQSVSYNYNVETTVMLQGIDANGEITLTEVTISQNKTEEATQDRFPRLAWVGFYNFNIGYRYSLGNDNQLVVEPFVKIPASSLNKENTNFTIGGLTLKYKF